MSQPPDETGFSSSLAPARRRAQPMLLFIGLAILAFAGWRIWADWPAPLMVLGLRHPADDLPPSPLEEFDLTRLKVLRELLMPGGPPKDGIPSLTAPKYVLAAQGGFMRPDDRVVGIVIDNDARAYPLRILDYHEVVNDRIGGIPASVTYCPLCDSVAAFDRRTAHGEVEFGVSGLLFNSNVLLYDRREDGAESLWSQLMAEAVSGPALDTRLKPLPTELTTWGDWLSRHADTKVLSIETGHRRDYSKSPYTDYFEVPGLFFPVLPVSDRLAEKEKVLGVIGPRTKRAYPISAFETVKEPRHIEQEIDGLRFVVAWTPSARSLRVVSADEGLSWTYACWFAWYAFHAATEVVDAAPK